jgi:hypothetical protein
VEAFNNERPHEALEMKCPAQLYRLAAALSSHPRTALPVSRPYRTVTSCDRLCVYRKKINLSVSLAGQAVGVKEVEPGIWLVSFMSYDLGYIDLEEKTLQPLDNPFGPKVSPMS